MKKLLYLLAISFSFQAHSGLLLEPFAGMAFNSSGEVASTDAEISGSTIGGRLGFQHLGFMLGLDGRQDKWNLDLDSGGDLDLSGQTLGFFVGYEFPVMLRVWANYIFSSEFENDDSDLKYSEGSGTILGIGYKALPFISLNLEISSIQTTKESTQDVDLEIDYNVYTLSISLPFSL